MACVDVPALPLQLLLQRHPDWCSRAAAVVDRDEPQGLLLWVNERARSLQVLPGMRYAAALALVGELRAAPMPVGEIQQAVADLGERLGRFTPGVEPVDGEPGVFWLDASGLERLYGSLSVWADGLRGDLRQVGFSASVAVGFSRFGSYAAARSKRGRVVFRDRDEERAVARGVGLDRLGLMPAIRDGLHRLGVDTVGAFVDLPPDGVGRRFGPAALRLHRLAAETLELPLQPRRPAPPATERLVLDQAETDVARLLGGIERLLPALLATLADRCQVLAGVQVGFRFERLGDHIERIRPAAPTLDAARILELIRLRLEGLRRLPDGVMEIVLLAEAVPAATEQRALLAERPRRDAGAADRALARVRAELGDDAVRRARLRDAHLPEGNFVWEALDGVASPRPRGAATAPVAALVRRIYARPVPLPPRPRQEPDGWMLHGLEQGAVVRVDGPYVVAGGWWNRPVRREYHFAETQKGELLWVYYDRIGRRWFLQGRVE
jgi:protein ImuB